MHDGAKYMEIMPPSNISKAVAILLNDNHDHPKAGSWSKAELVSDNDSEYDLYRKTKTNYSDLSVEMFKFISDNDIQVEDWMESILMEKYMHGGWDEYLDYKIRYKLIDPLNCTEKELALIKIVASTVDIASIPDLNNPTPPFPASFIEKMTTMPIVAEIALGSSNLTEENKTYYTELRQQIIEHIEQYGDNMSKETLEKIIEISDYMTNALCGFNDGATIQEALEVFEKQINKILGI